MEHYLDNSATTAVCAAAAEKALKVMTEVYGNPSSLHTKGIEAEKELEQARGIIASKLGAQVEEIFFTSGGTEANNLAVFGAAEAKKRSGKRIIISSTEHSSTLEAAKYLEQNGYDVVYISPREDGVVHSDDVLEAVNGNTTLLSVMYVNNETGAVNPVAEIFEAAKLKSPGLICHTDAVQVFGKLEIKAKKLNADIISVSGHKVFAPKGVGAIFIKRGIRLVPRQYGGEQEKKIRPGTEPLPLIAAFGAACAEFDIKKNYEAVSELNAYAKEKLSQIDGVLINSPQEALPYVLNITAGRVRSETMLHFLEEREIYVSSGSACAKGKPSHVLSAMGFDKQRADSALRISFSKHNTKEDIDALCEGIELGLKVLAHR